jgi:hypothetical protein
LFDEYLQLSACKDTTILQIILIFLRVLTLFAHKSCPFIQEISTIMDWGCHGFSETAGSKYREFMVVLHKKIKKEILLDFTYIPT